MGTFNADATVVPEGAKVLAAVSSGADSMALLCWLLALGREVVVGHVNHALHELRPGECARDEEFVRDKCTSLGVEFRSTTVELPRRNSHVNEAVAREARYDALAEIARQNECLLVATAHTATDGLETALLNLMRGGGLGGWQGIAPNRALTDSIDLVRPFWNVPREATRQLLLDNGWQWREDASNLEPLFRRNRVRHELLPLLSEISGHASDELAMRVVRNAALARDETRWMDSLTIEALDLTSVKSESGRLILDGLVFQNFDVALQRRVLRRAAQILSPNLRDLSLEKVETTRLAVASGARRMVWTWRKDLRVEWTGAHAGNRIRFWVVNSN